VEHRLRTAAVEATEAGNCGQSARGDSAVTAEACETC